MGGTKVKGQISDYLYFNLQIILAKNSKPVKPLYAISLSCKERVNKI